MTITPTLSHHAHLFPTRPSAPKRWRAAVLATLLLTSFAGTAVAASIRVFVETRESGRPPVLNGGDGDGASFNDGSPHSGAAAFGFNTASFDIAPQLGQLALLGQSATTTFAEWGGLLRETRASGQVEISDRFRVEGSIVGTVAGFFVARVSGSLLPNLDFEGEYHQARGDATITTISRTLFTLAQRTQGGVVSENRLHDQVGSWLGSGSPCGAACVIGTEIEVEFLIPLLISDDSREFDFNLNFAATGTRGGGFDFGGGAPLTGAEQLLASLAGSPASTLSFELRLPAGLSFRADGGHFMHLAPLEPGGPALPEPPVLALLMVAAAAACAARRRR